MIYDSKVVKVHHFGKTPVLLINEAPGQEEAYSGIPLYGAQGGNVIRLLIKANINWAKNWSLNHPDFSWPIKQGNHYSKLTNQIKRNLADKQDFLDLRRKYIACSNSFPQWPKLSLEGNNFIEPSSSDIISCENLYRLRKEVKSTEPIILLVCGNSAYLACAGVSISSPSKIAGTQLLGQIKNVINERIRHDFKEIWYLGHTRRWSLNQSLIINCLASLKTTLGW